MSMPPESSSLPNNGVVINIALAGLYGALCYICRTICPTASKLSNSMPVPFIDLVKLTKHIFVWVQLTEEAHVCVYQWIEILFGTWLMTLMSRRSPSLATIRGPGNFPFTVTMLLVWHSRVTFCSLICLQTRRKGIARGDYYVFLQGISRPNSNTWVETYVELVMPSYGTCIACTCRSQMNKEAHYWQRETKNRSR